MLFRRNRPLQVELVPPPTDQHTPQMPSYTVPILPRRPARTLEEILGLSPNLPKSVGLRPSSPTKNDLLPSPTRAGHSTAQRLPRRESSSKNTGHATIRTDATDTQAAFESDAFAVHMPTTRLPIIDKPVSPITTTRAAQIEAYRTYEENARQIRERSNSQGVQVPAKTVSYEHTSTHLHDRPTPVIPAIGPPVASPKPAGSFPISPPLPQSSWERSERRQAIYVPSLRTTEESSILHTPRKPTVAKSDMSPNTTRFRSRAGSEAGASAPTPTPIPSPTPRPNPIRIRVQTKPIPQEPERVQTESTYSLYNRRLATTSKSRSRSTSPGKSMPNFTQQISVEGDSIFGYRSKELAGTTIDASSSHPPSPTKSDSSEKEAVETKAKEKEEAGTKKERTRWPWLKPSGPRLAKPTTTPVVFATTAARVAATHAQARPVSTYVAPFVRHATPPAPTASLHKTPAILRPASTLQPPSEQHVSAGFLRLKSFSLIVLRIAFYLYTLIALWFILDAVREAFHTISLPFHLLRFLWRYLWSGVIWTARVVLGLWARWGFKVALNGGWMWKW